MPRSGTAARVAHLGKPKAFPGAATWKLALADLAGKLPRQHGFLTALVQPEDNRAKLAMTPTVAADHLLLGEDRVTEDGVGGRGHPGCAGWQNASCVIWDGQQPMQENFPRNNRYIWRAL